MIMDNNLNLDLFNKLKIKIEILILIKFNLTNRFKKVKM